MNVEQCYRGRTTQYDKILSAWRAQVATAAGKPELAQRLLYREHELLPRFAAQYEKLAALPRRTRRTLQRQWKQSLAGVALLLALGQAPAMAATINVGGGGGQTSAPIKVCSLVDAITAANTDTATGGCPAGSGADRIVLPKGSTQTLTAVNNNDPVGLLPVAPNGLPVITSNITINGNGATIKRASSAQSFRIFAIDGRNAGGGLTLRNTTVSGGRLSAYDQEGGALLNYYGKVTLTGSTISGNSTGGVQGDGGGILTRGDTGKLVLNRSTVSGNSAKGDNTGGVGIYNIFGAVVLTNSTVSGNRTTTGGGGVYSTGSSSSLTLTNSTISGNSTPGFAGGVGNGGTLTVINSTISGNTSGDNGGGVNNRFETATIANSTITRNSAASGGGVYNENYGTVTLGKTLISGNTAANGREVFNVGGFAKNIVNANNFNVFGFNGDAGVSGFTPGATDIVPPKGVTLPKILKTTLASNDGPTKTHALVSGSPAIDSVSDGTCPPPTKDQRGVKRPQDGNGDGGPACDTGSYELKP